jgi:threonylcarbamoyladenosine tRNA methylthiotransferase MtaB
MPQVPRAAVKERARRLREVGAAALRRHLAGEVGTRRRILVETGRLGRTEAFTQVRFPRDVAAGTMLDATIAGHDGTELLAA